MRNTFPVPYRKGRPANVIGAHCVMPYQGRTLLGKIERIEYQDGARGAYIATVRHFNGEAWPIAPCVGSLRLLDRSAQSGGTDATMIAALSAECKKLEDDREYNANLVTEYRRELNNAVELLRIALNYYDAEASVGLPTTDRFGIDRRARTRQFLVAYDQRRA